MGSGSQIYKMIPATYQPDSEDTQKENPQLKYVKMYEQDYVNGLFAQIKELTETLHSAINDSSNRGTQRAAIPVLKRGYARLKDREK